MPDAQSENWQIEKLCKDVNDYELSIEKQKTDWSCSQSYESWKWSVAFHGSIVASGLENSPDAAKEKALTSMPQNKDKL
ncbi:MAG: hypothetical protein ACLFR0_08055 [Alphaproteobacteria bacterium]